MQRYLPIIIGLVILGGLGYFAYTQYFKYFVPKGDLKITIVSNGQPVKNLEVDVNENPGPPKYHDETDKNGVVLFEGLPIGNYAIYFNQNNFPNNLEYPRNNSYAAVKQNSIKEKEIELKSKK